MIKVKDEEILLGVRPLNMARKVGASPPARGSSSDLQAPGLQLALMRGICTLQSGSNRVLPGRGITRRDLKPWKTMRPSLE